MKIKLEMNAVKRSKWYEFVIRFVFGGLVAATAGIIAKKFGPATGGLFLAFPAIFPATATLIESHEKRKKRKAGLDGTRRGRQAAGIDAAGAAIGAIGLIGFAVVLRLSLSSTPTWLSLCLAALTWAVLSFAGWSLWRGKFVKTLLAKIKHPSHHPFPSR
jgi:hypothetical protein